MDLGILGIVLIIIAGVASFFIIKKVLKAMLIWGLITLVVIGGLGFFAYHEFNQFKGDLLNVDLYFVDETVYGAMNTNLNDMSEYTFINLNDANNNYNSKEFDRRTLLIHKSAIGDEVKIDNKLYNITDVFNSEDPVKEFADILNLPKIAIKQNLKFKSNDEFLAILSQMALAKKAGNNSGTYMISKIKDHEIEVYPEIKTLSLLNYVPDSFFGDTK